MPAKPQPGPRKVNQRRHPRLTATRLRLALCALLALGAAPALAQAVPNAGQLLNETQRADKEAAPRAPAPELIQENAPRAAINLPAGVQIAVSHFRISGAKAFGTQSLADLVKPWEGQTLDVNGLNDAAGAITRHYQNQGFLLAYAYLPVQKIEQGVVEIAVLEGTVDSVQIVTAQDVRLSDEAIQSYVQGIAQAPQMRQAELESRLLMLNDIPGVVARASFAPGSRAGTADVIVTVAEEEPLVYSVDFNNQGSKSTGEYRLGAQFQLRNLFGQGDSTRLRLQSSTGMELVTGSLSTRMPLGGQGWSADASASRLSYELGAPYAALGARGEASTVHLGLGRQLLRSIDQNLSLSAGYDYKDLVDVLELGGSNNRKHSAQLALGLTASQRDALLGGGQWQASLGYVAGTLDWDSPNSIQAPSGQFRKFSLDLSRRQALDADWSATARVNGQWALDNLDSSEKYALSGPYGVRAFAPGQASVDRGGVLALELRRAWALSGGLFSASVFYDAAYGRYAVKPAAGVSNSVHLHGGGLGLGWANGADLDLSLTAAWSDSPAPSADGDRQPSVYFQITKGF